MTTASTDILTAALALPDAERLDIAERLWASVKPIGAMNTDDAESLRELERRLGEADAKSVSGDEAMRRLWQSQSQREQA